MEEGSSQRLYRKIRNLVRRLLNVPSAARLGEEIQDLIDHGAEQGVITPGEGEMIQSIFELGDTVAREIMVPRTGISALAAGSPVSQVIDLIIESGHTRLPIYQGDIDHIVGILHAKDLLSSWGVSAQEPLPTAITRPPYFVPETKKLLDLLSELRARKSHMAIVLDEYGGTAGLVTLEDVIEEIIGDIRDEYDVEEELITRIDKETILVDARLNLEELADYLGVELPEGEYETVGGFVTDLTGRVPQENEQVVYQDLLMTIRSADERKVNQIEIKHPPSTGNLASDAA
ncbi:MAG: hemolysin family protein [Pseudomonadota bacterium]